MAVHNLSVEGIEVVELPEDPVVAVEHAIELLDWARSHGMTFTRKQSLTLDHARRFAAHAIRNING